MAQDPRPSHSTLYNALFVPGLILAGLILIALAVLAFGDKVTGGNGGDSDQKRQVSEQLMQRFESEYDRKGIAIGDADAPVTIREFADYQCPACAAFASTAKKVREEYVAAGKVRFVFFDFPLPMHSHAVEAAAAARCAGRADKFWVYHDKLFATQSEWAGKSDATDYFLDLAVQTQVPLDPFQRCLAQGATESLISENAQIARDVGAVATPTVLVGDRVFSGVTSYSRIEREIENRLAAAATGSGDQ